MMDNQEQITTYAECVKGIDTARANSYFLERYGEFICTDLGICWKLSEDTLFKSLDGIYLPDVKTIDFSQNRLQCLKGITFAPKNLNLLLRGNELTSASLYGVTFKNVETITFCYNNINIDSFVRPPNLKKICLCNNY